MTEDRAEQEETLSEIERLKEAATAALDKASIAQQEVKGLVEEIKESRQAAQTASDFIATKKTEITTTATQISSVLTDAKSDRESTEDLAEKSSALEQTIERQTDQLKQLTDQAETLTEKIEQLLPGATSTGLAKSFMDRKKSFVWPTRGWAFLTLASILSLVGVGLWGSDNFVFLAKQPTTDWIDLFRAVLLRLPIALPLIWLAIHAGRHHFLAARLQEDYGYKEVLSRSFEGYKRELEDVNVTAPEISPLTQLCSNVLSTLAAPPGRLFDRKHPDFTPLNALLDSVDPKLVAELMKRYSLTQDQAGELIKLIVGSLVK